MKEIAKHLVLLSKSSAIFLCGLSFQVLQCLLFILNNNRRMELIGVILTNDLDREHHPDFLKQRESLNTENRCTKSTQVDGKEKERRVSAI